MGKTKRPTLEYRICIDLFAYYRQDLYKKDVPDVGETKNNLVGVHCGKYGLLYRTVT